MNTYAPRIPRRQTAITDAPVQQKSVSGMQAPGSVVQRHLQERADAYSQQLPVQRKENKTGLPDNLKSGIENLSGYSMNDVKVHYNSDAPAKLQAHAYAQGSDIHVAPGQEKHLPHEAWHVVQQKQGRVKATRQLKGTAVNDNPALEKEADAMGEKALQAEAAPAQLKIAAAVPVVQRVAYTTLAQLFAAEFPNRRLTISYKNNETAEHIREAEAQMPYADFIHNVNMPSPQVNPNIPGPNGTQTVEFNPNMQQEDDLVVAYFVHELIHIASSRKYNKNNLRQQNSESHYNVHLPKGHMKEQWEKNRQDQNYGLTQSQMLSSQQQARTIVGNWNRLDAIVQRERREMSNALYQHLNRRIGYAVLRPLVENDTVLFDIVYMLERAKMKHLDTYDYALEMLKEARERRNLVNKTKKDKLGIPRTPRDIQPGAPKSSFRKAFTQFTEDWPPTIM